MYDLLESTILGTAQTIYDQFGWAGVFTIMVLENATGITPSEVILSLAGWMLIEAHNLHPGMILLGGLYAGLGSAMGASIAYWVARLGGRPVVDTFARWFRIDVAHIDKAEEHVSSLGDRDGPVRKGYSRNPHPGELSGGAGSHAFRPIFCSDICRSLCVVHFVDRRRLPARPRMDVDQRIRQGLFPLYHGQRSGR